MLKKYTPQTLCIWLLISLWAIASSAVQALEVQENYYNLSPSFEYLVDEQGDLRLEDIQQAEMQAAFQSAREAKPKATRGNTALWLKIELSFDAQHQDPFVLTTLMNNFQSIWLYRQNSDGGFSEYQTGNSYPANQREIDASRFSFYIQPAPGKQTLYLRTVGAIDTFQIPWVLLEQKQFDQINDRFMRVNLIVAGAVVGILILCLGLGLTLANLSYLVYSVFLFCGLISLMNQDGLSFILFWPNHPALNEYIIDILNMGMSATRLCAVIIFLNISRLAPRLFNFCLAWLAALAVLFVFSVTTGLTFISIYFGGIVWLVSMMLCLGICIYAITKKAPFAIPLLIILNLPVIGNIYQAGVSTGVFDISILGLQSAKIFFLLHALLFSVCIAYEIKSRIKARQTAQLDNLTGLPRLKLAKSNFNYAAEVADRHDWKIAVLFIDLDGFKAVNDKLGHKIGDHLLKEVAARIKKALRETDTAARIGGDEFLVIQTEVKQRSAYTAVADNIVKQLSKPFIIGGNTLSIGASVGIAVYPEHGRKLPELMIAADHAMYTIKKSGKNAFKLASATPLEASGKDPLPKVTR